MIDPGFGLRYGVVPGLLCLLGSGVLAAEEGWPKLPERNAAVEIPAQEWPLKPGPRTIRVLVHFPGGMIDKVTPQTGLMLSLHNWGGEDCVGTASPTALADRLNVVAICVNYLQSGKKASIDDPEPYDFGYLQGLDALRALWFVMDGLRQTGREFDAGRVFATGGSGGGNVTLMANKLAPRTFAAIIPICGMNKLDADGAFNLPGGSDLDARWSRDPRSPNYLSADAREIRFLGSPEHLAVMRKLGARGRIYVVHGRDDQACLFPAAQEMVDLMRAAELPVEPWFIGKDEVDGKIFTTTGHAVGNRTEIVFKVAGTALAATGEGSLRREGPSDFDLKDELVRYPTPGGEFVISYKAGYPVGRFEPRAIPPTYKEHQDLSYYLTADGEKHPIKTPEDWQIRKAHILDHLQRVTGRVPGSSWKVPLDVKVLEETDLGKVIRKKITYQSDPFDRVPAWVFLPKNEDQKTPLKQAAVLALHQTNPHGKDEPAGIKGLANMKYAIELAELGYVVLDPDYPNFGEHKYNFAAHPEYLSGTLKAVWDNMRAVDLLESMPEVDAARIGAIGHSLGGHNTLLTGALEPRLKVLVSSCGYCSFQKDDVPSWTGPTYMPVIASEFGNDANRVPFDFNELVASFAPRPFFTCAATRDADFDVTGVQDCINSARPIYELYGAADNLQAIYPDAPHDFPSAAREAAYAFLARHLKGKGK